MADQVSLPNIAGSDVRCFLRTWPGLYLLGRDRMEQQRIVQPEDDLLLWHRLFQELPVALFVQHAIASHGVGGEARKIRLGDDMDVEQHVGKAVAGEMRRQALIL